MDREEQQHYIKKERITNDTNGEYQDPLATIDPVPITFEILKKEEDNIKEEDLHPDDVFQYMSEHPDFQHNLNEHEYYDADNTFCNDDIQEDLDNKCLILSFLKNEKVTGNLQNAEKKMSINEGQEFSSAFQCNDDMNSDHTTDISNRKLNIENNFKLYTCGECNKMFSQYRYLKNHITATHQARGSDITSNKCNFSSTDNKLNTEINKNYACIACDEKYSSISDVKNHNKTVHLGNSYYKCVACNKTYFHSDRLKQHSCLVHKYECQICNKQFSHPSHLKQHSVAHNDKIQNTLMHMEKKYICDVCHRSFSEFTVMKYHINAEHFMITPVGKEPCKHNEQSVADHSKQKYVCYNCGSNFFEFSQIKNHINESHCQEIIKNGKEMSIDTENQKHACKHCGKTYNIITDLTHHIKTVHLGAKRYECDHCHKTFSQISFLKAHIILVHKNNEGELYACSSCDERYSYHQDLTFHISEKHSGIGSYKCVICNKIIKRPHHLTRHYKDVHKIGNLTHRIKTVHLESEKYQCDHCHETFSQLSLLNAHIILVHKNNEGELYGCSSCDERYTYHQDLTFHISEKHSGIGSYKCVVCNKIIKRPHHLTRHYKDVHSISTLTKKYQYNSCHKTFSLPSVPKTHTKLVHKNIQSGLYACSSCDERYVYHQDLTYHINENHSGISSYKCNKVIKQPYHLTKHYKDVHKNLCLNLEHLKSRRYVRFYKPVKNKKCSKVLSKVNKENKFECGDCNKRFFEFSCLQTHIFRAHSNRDSVKDNFYQKDKIYACSTCNESYAWVSDLKHHIDSSHSGIGGYQCRLCNKTIFCYSRVKNHMRAIHKYKELKYFDYSKIFTCGDCGKKHSTLSKLRDHINGMHLGISDFKCKQCNKIYFGLSELRRHYKTEKHKNFMKLECDHCKKKFSNLSLLKVHIGVHSRLKNIECAHCGKMFFIFSDLKEHINRAHLKIRDLQCEHCGKKFYNKMILQGHVNSVHKKIRKYECQFCYKKFQTSLHLQNHIVCVHERVKSFVCEQCGSRFLLAHHLKNHENAVHKGIKR